MPMKGYELKFPDHVPTITRTETLGRIKNQLLKEPTITPNDLITEAWKEPGITEDLNIIRVSVQIE